MLQLHDGVKIMARIKIKLVVKWTEGLQTHSAALPPNTISKNIQADRVDVGPQIP